MLVANADGTRMFQMIEKGILHAGLKLSNEMFPGFRRGYTFFEAGTCKGNESVLLSIKKFQRFGGIFLSVNVSDVRNKIMLFYQNPIFLQWPAE